MTEDEAARKWPLGDVGRQAAGTVIGGVVLGGAGLVAGLLAGYLDEPMFWLATLALASLAVAAVGWFLAGRRRRELEQLRSGARPATAVSVVQARGGERLMGLDIGRTRLVVGVLEVHTPDLDRLPNRRDPKAMTLSASYEPLEGRWEMSPRRIFDDLVTAIMDVSAAGAPLDGIGLGIPGQVDPVEGRVHHSPGAFERHAEVVDALASRLAERPDAARRLRLDGVPPGADLRAAIADRILIDNDVRCATRALLSEHVDDPGWENFSCVFVGTGVGSGLVIGRQMYYGRGNTAGEVGHMTLDVASDAVVCECGKAGLHWETLINGEGLEMLAGDVDAEASGRLARAYGGEGLLTAPQIATLFEFLDGHWHDGLVPDAVASALQEAPDLVEYVERVLAGYARYVAVGVANLVNVLNLDHIVMGGGVMDGVYASKRFRNAVAESIAAHGLEIPVSTLKGPRPEAGARSGWAWQGSALLFRDPSFQRVLTGGR